MPDLFHVFHRKGNAMSNLRQKSLWTDWDALRKADEMDDSRPPNSSGFWDITRNGRLYDAMKPSTHAVRQIAKSYARDMPNDHWRLFDSSGVMQWSQQPVKKGE